MSSILSSKPARILTVVLLAQAAVFYGFSRSESTPPHVALGGFTVAGTPWTLLQDVEIDKDTLEVLKADDILSRTYRNRTTGQDANLFVAYFQTQRTGKTPHSPKNCLPGSGWVPSESSVIQITAPGEAQPIEANRYVVSRGENQSVVIYWYQSGHHTVASEYKAKIYTVTDAIRYNRTDTTLVRVVVSVPDGNTKAATARAVGFIQSILPPLKPYLPA